MNSELSTNLKNPQRNELLYPLYAAIDTECRKSGNRYILFAVAIVDSVGNTIVKHEFDISNNSQSEKELVKWAMPEILKYKLTIGWYSKGERVKSESGLYTGKDSDLKILDDVCRFYNGHPIYYFHDEVFIYIVCPIY
jgi:hypothetical protein